MTTGNNEGQTQFQAFTVTDKLLELMRLKPGTILAPDLHKFTTVMNLAGLNFTRAIVDSEHIKMVEELWRKYCDKG